MLLSVSVDQLNWTRIGLITDDTHYHLYAAEMLQKKLLENPKRSIAPYIRIDKTHADLNLQEFAEYGTQIIIMLTKKELECLLLSKTAKMNYIWPNYASIFLNLDSNHYGIECRIEGVFHALNSMLVEDDRDLSDNRNMQCNTYFNIQLQSILAVSSAQGLNLSDQPYEGSNDNLKFRGGQQLINVSILQIQDGIDTVVATYSSDLQELKFSYTRLAGDKIPSGRLRVLKNGNSMLENILIPIIFAFSFVFITVNLILYFIFRKSLR